MNKELLRQVKDKVRSSEYVHSMFNIFDDLDRYLTKAICTDEYVITSSEAANDMFVIVFDSVTDTHRLANDVKYLIDECKVKIVYLNDVAKRYLSLYINSAYKVLVAETCFTMKLEPTVRCIEKPMIVPEHMLDKIINNVIGKMEIDFNSPLYEYVIETLVSRVLSNEYFYIGGDDIILTQLFVKEFDNCAYVGGVLTREEYRGNGLAQELLSRVISKYANKNMTMYLNVSTNNECAIHMYKKLGFKECGLMYSFTIMS